MTVVQVMGILSAAKEAHELDRVSECDAFSMDYNGENSVMNLLRRRDFDSGTGHGRVESPLYQSQSTSLLT
jgi:hypothetical protein